MPEVLLDFMGYKFFFWSNEGGEPIHIHISKGKQTENVTKFWIKRDTIELVHNNSGIPQNELKKIQKYIWANRDTIMQGGINTLAYRADDSTASIHKDKKAL